MTNRPRARDRGVRRAASLLLAAVVALGAASAEARPRRQASEAADANAGVVSVISGPVSGTFVQVASDLSFVLDDGERLRVLPVIGKGAEQNLRDVLMLKGIDVGIVRSDGLEAMRKDPAMAEKAKSIAYVTRLFTDEAHLVAGPGVTDIRQLAGRKVNFDIRGSGANFTGRLMFERLGIAVEAVNLDQPTAYEMLRKGEIAATFQMSAKPVQSLARIDAEANLHLVDIPFDERISDLYLPGELTREDYPNLVKGAPVGTVAASSILAVYKWPEGSARYRKVARFVDALFSKLPEFQKAPRHPKWTEVNLAAEVPGWTRFKAAQDWLDRNAGATPAKGAQASR